MLNVDDDATIAEACERLQEIRDRRATLDELHAWKRKERLNLVGSSVGVHAHPQPPTEIRPGSHNGVPIPVERLPKRVGEIAEANMDGYERGVRRLRQEVGSSDPSKFRPHESQPCLSTG